MKSKKLWRALILTAGLVVLTALGGCATSGPGSGVVRYGYPSKQEVRRGDRGLTITDWKVNETTGQMVKTTYLTNL